MNNHSQLSEVINLQGKGGQSNIYLYDSEGQHGLITGKINLTPFADIKKEVQKLE